VSIVNIQSLERFEDGASVTPEQLKSAGLIDSLSSPVKLLGKGELKKRLMIHVHRVSASAKAKVQEAGGSVELIAVRSAT
jgi:large subunit ribosomal protein L15